MPFRVPIDLPEGAVRERLRGPRVSVSDRVVGRLRSELGDEAVAGDEATREAFGRDWWPLAVVWATEGHLPTRPAVVARPRSADGVAAAVAVCAEERVPLTAAAGRSGVCGGALPVAGGVVLDLTGLDAVADVDDTSLLLRAGPGIFGDALERDLRARGYTLGHWPQSMELSTLGGWLACRSAGQYSTRYGKIEDMVVGLEAVTGTGARVRAGGAPRAAVGPDLLQLLVGSEGTLGVVTEATLRIHPAPPAEERLVFGLPSFAAGLDACRRILRRGATPAVLRLHDREESRRDHDQDANVLVVLDEGDPGIVAATMGVVAAECRDTEGAERLDEDLAARWLEHRNDVSALPAVVRAGVVVDTVELAAPWRSLPGLHDDVTAALRAVDGALAVGAHCSHSYTDGACLYFTFAGQPGDDPDTKDAYYRESIDAVMRAAMARGAAISHHHGVGLARGAYVREALGDGAFEVLASVKRALDPHGILNPGKLGLPSPFLPEDWTWT